jgi:hypothetical protein
VIISRLPITGLNAARNRLQQSDIGGSGRYQKGASVYPRASPDWEPWRRGRAFKQRLGQHSRELLRLHDWGGR